MLSVDHQTNDSPNQGSPLRNVVDDEFRLVELFAEMSDNPQVSHMRTLDVVGQDGLFLGTICLIRGPEACELMDQAVLHMIGEAPSVSH